MTDGAGASTLRSLPHNLDVKSILNLAARLCALGLLLTSAACSSGDGGPPRRAIMIVLDAARGDRFSCNGYERETTPNMDRLAAGGVNFSLHFANGVATRNSMPTLMYSRTFAKPIFPVHLSTPFYRPEDLFRAMDPEAISLPAALAADGIRTVGISAHQWFHEDSEFAREFQEFHDLPRKIGYDAERAAPLAEDVIDYALAWLETVDEDEEFFLYLHLMDTHFPHFLDEDAAEMFGADEYAAERFNSAGYPHDLTRPLEDRDREYMDALYDGDLRYLDRHLGRLFDHLRDEEQLDSTLIAITADHGEELLHQVGRFAHASWWDPVARIPMILSYPDRVAPAEVEALTQNIDVHPTLLELLDVPLPAGKSVDGLHLLEGHDDGRREVVHAWCGLRTERYKLITNLRALLEDPTWGGAVLYDLSTDPEERTDVSSSESDLVQSLLADAEKVMRPRFERYQAVDIDRAPPYAFAIEPLYLRLSGADAAAAQNLTSARAAAGEAGWARDDRSLTSFLLAGPEAGEVTLEVEVPSGSYELALSVAGSCRVELNPGDEQVEISGPAFDPDQRPDSIEAVDAGVVVVRDRTFRVRIVPVADAGPMVLAGIQFRPLGLEEEDEDARRRREALERLGY